MTSAHPTLRDQRGDAFNLAPLQSRQGSRARSPGPALVSRPIPGCLEAVKLTDQVSQERAERAALRDRVPPAALADSPPGKAVARGDLSQPQP